MTLSTRRRNKCSISTRSTISSHRIASPHGCCPKNGLRVYFPKDIVAKRVANEFGIAILDEIVIHENRQGAICYAEIN